jgi:putative transposase
VSDADLALMCCIDELPLEHPFAGARLLRDMLGREGHAVGRKHVATLMERMGSEALYRKPTTSKQHPAQRALPTGCVIRRPEYACCDATAVQVVSDTRVG